MGSSDTGAGTAGGRRAGVRLTADFAEGNVKEFFLDVDSPEEAIKRVEREHPEDVSGVIRWSWSRLEWL
jgi:hypothetical protein